MNLQEIITNGIIPASAAIIAFAEYKRTVQHTILEFLSQGNTDIEKDRRKRIYKEFEAKNHNLNLEDLELLDKDGDVGKIISFYDAWATVVKQHYLPIKYFKGINGVTAVRLYYIIEPYIDYRRSRDTTIKHDDKNIVLLNDSYAKNYEWLIKKIIDKNYVKTIEQNEQS